ncbi:uncharacterized protein LOC144363043 [Saccoglossus kowalevskii]
MATDTSPIPAKRIILWTYARTRSTVFELSVSSVPTIKVFHEPYLTGLWMGEEKEHETSMPSVKGHSKEDVKPLLEADYPGYEAIFVKDYAYALRGKTNYGFIPRGFVHTFLIRNPQAVVPSYYKRIKIDKETGLVLHDDVVKSTMALGGDPKPLYELYQYVKEDLGQQAIVLDSDDLIESPRDMMKKYCNESGLPFAESMLNWKPGNISHWPECYQGPEWSHYYQRAIDSSSFVVNKHKVEQDNIQDLPEKLIQFIEKSKVVYEEMAKYKL